MSRDMDREAAAAREFVIVVTAPDGQVSVIGTWRNRNSAEMFAASYQCASPASAVLAREVGDPVASIAGAAVAAARAAVKGAGG